MGLGQGPQDNKFQDPSDLYGPTAAAHNHRTTPKCTQVGSTGIWSPRCCGIACNSEVPSRSMGSLQICSALDQNRAKQIPWQGDSKQGRCDSPYRRHHCPFHVNSRFWVGENIARLLLACDPSSQPTPAVNATTIGGSQRGVRGTGGSARGSGGGDLGRRQPPRSQKFVTGVCEIHAPFERPLIYSYGDLGGQPPNWGSQLSRWLRGFEAARSLYSFLHGLV
jgi:hypothetical protein